MKILPVKEFFNAGHGEAFRHFVNAPEKIFPLPTQMLAVLLQSIILLKSFHFTDTT
jgi:hypothetical protein